MTPAFQVLLCLCLLDSLNGHIIIEAPRARNVRWCVASEAEEQKCNDLVNSCTVKEILLICVKKSSTEDCMRAISAGEADAISLDIEDIYKASIIPFHLKPIMTETYGSQKDIRLNQDPSQKEHQHLLKGGQPLQGAFEPKSDEKESTPCLRDRQRVLGAKKPRIGAFVPECDEKGNYVPKQCYGSTGYCWCVDEHGEETAAGRARQGKAEITCEYTGSEMPCMKERRDVLSRGQPLRGAFVPDCDEKGNYIPKQFHGSTGYSWCVDENGAEISGSKTPPGQPTPTCGAYAGATCIKERYKVLGAGQPLVGAFIPDCDEEGHYRPMQCHGSTGYCWCVSKDGVEIQGTRTAPGQSPPTCEAPDLVKFHYAVAVVKKSSTLQFNQLKGKRSCHSAMGKTTSWIAPLHALFKKNLLLWEGSEKKSFEKAVSEFFSASCAPGAKEENLCQQCAGLEDKCKRGPGEPYYGDEGAFRCLREDKGDVAFVEDTALSGLDSDNFELLCPDNTRSPLSEHKDCNFGKVPPHAVVTRSTGDKTKDIIKYVLQAQKKECKLFSSTHGEDMMSGDITANLIALPSGMDASLFLGPELFNAMKTLHGAPLPSKNEIRWCTQNENEKIKCDDWSAVSGGAIKCTEPSSADQCIEKILKREADAVTLSAEHMHTALKCGLVPAVEGYHNKDDFSPCNIDGDFYADFGGTTRVVALVKKSDKDITWNNLKGKNSCHTGVGHWAGWMLPVSLISKQTKNCDIGSYFTQSCAPGSAINSNLCKLCIGDPENTKAQTRCSLSDKEAYYGDAGAIRCLVEKGDVAFVTNTAVIKNTDGNNPALWAKDLKSTDFELLCPDGSRAPVSDSRNCHLPGNPGPSVVSREENVDDVIRMFLNQQSRYGRNGLEKHKFQMYSSYGEHVLFSDDTQCMIAFDRIIGRDIIEDILGKDFPTAMVRENPCLAKSELRTACTFRAEKM